MKKVILFTALLAAGSTIGAQAVYPDPEFTNEIYQYRKDSAVKLLRLEKGSSKMDTKMKMGGFGGAESGYTLEGEKSGVRISSGKGLLSFIISTGRSGSGSSAQTDSMMRANGVDPSDMGGFGMDPTQMISLYKTNGGKDSRKVLVQKSGGMFSAKKTSSSDKYTFSVRKVREGYWELVIDKTLPKGEYAFTMMSMGNMDGSLLLYAFGVD
ncbi:MAG: hypothetical protein JNK14_07940 [Chitinophagaceae bacterium]|nr:hypothetical protein [Chitinophagaceae bacterium]